MTLVGSLEINLRIRPQVRLTDLGRGVPPPQHLPASERRIEKVKIAWWRLTRKNLTLCHILLI